MNSSVTAIEISERIDRKPVTAPLTIKQDLSVLDPIPL